MSPRWNDPVTVATTGTRLAAPSGVHQVQAVAVAAELLWAPADPYAVALVLGDKRVNWLVARELLWAGLRFPVGHGDIRVVPAGQIVWIRLCSPSGRAVFEFQRIELARFLRATRDRVAFGSETRALGIGIELACLLNGPLTGEGNAS